ncbi:cation diffusion facilitator family transporter, partial [Klebsiella pneumoniae]|nr:cation diffusion facilitator family transporter [Klebsiella pneumoniae]
MRDDQFTDHKAGRRSTVVSVCFNVLLATLQIVIGLLATSQALLSDGIHSLSDLVSDFVVLFAGQHSTKGPDDNHPYGHQRFENAAALVRGVLLLGVGVGMLWT